MAQDLHIGARYDV